MEEKIPSLEQLITYQDAEAYGEPVVEDPVVDPEEDKKSDIDPAEGDDPESDKVDDPEEEKDDVEPDSDEDSDPEPAEDLSRDEPEKDSKELEGADMYTNYYNHLLEGGFLVLSDDFEFDGTPEKLEEAFAASEDNKWQYMKDKMLEKIPEEGKPLFNYFMAGGRNIQEYIDTYGTIDFDSVDVTSVRDQKRVLKEYYQRTSNYTDDKIDRMIDKLESLDSLHEDASEALQDLVDLESRERAGLAKQTEAAEIAREKRYREERSTIQNSVDKSNFINDQRKGQVKAFLFNQVTRGEQTTTDYNRALSQISSNPSHIAQLADILLDYNPDKGFDMGRFESRGTSKANKNFRDTLDAKLDPKSKVSGKGSSPKQEQVNWEELLMQMEG